VIERIDLATARGLERWSGGGERAGLEALLPGDGPWELEIGFGKGRFLLGRAAAAPERRWLGIELAREYFRLAARRLARRRLGNAALLRGEALALLATALPPAFASALHVYFPDPWPKSRHQRRRLFAPGSIDLLFAALAPGGELFFATDHADYGEEVRRLLESFPGARVELLPGLWPDGPRTNYEAKYVAEGRAIVRLVARHSAPVAPHPAGLRTLTVAFDDRAQSAEGEVP